MTDGDSFPALLAGYRQLRRLSQGALARRLGCNHGIVSRWEAGNRHPSRDSVRAVATGLRLDAADRDRLFLAAGFVPDDLSPALVAEAVSLLRMVERWKG